MNIFSEVKEQLTTRQVAESYGLRIRKNGVACCPFHDDRHPSMKVDKNYHCFACGVGGDVIDYTARMYGLSQYDAAKKLIEDFGLHVQTEAMSREERQRLRREKEERMRIIQIKKRFYRWCEETIELLKDALVQIEDSGQVLYGKPPDVIFSEDYAMMLMQNQSSIIGWIFSAWEVSKRKKNYLCRAEKRWSRLQEMSENGADVSWHDVGKVLEEEISRCRGYSG